MPLSYEVSATKNLLTVLAQGAVDLIAARQLVEQLGHESSFTAEQHILVDLSSASCSPTSADVRKLVDLFGTRLTPNRNRIAVVVGSSFHFGMARMASMLAEGRNIQMHVFLDKADALAWIERGEGPQDDLAA